MKVSREKSRVVKGVTYFKWRTFIPNEIADQMGLKDGDELEPRLERGDLVLTPTKKRAKPKPSKAD